MGVLQVSCYSPAEHSNLWKIFAANDGRELFLERFGTDQPSLSPWLVANLFFDLAKNFHAWVFTHGIVLIDLASCVFHVRERLVWLRMESQIEFLGFGDGRRDWVFAGQHASHDRWAVVLHVTTFIGVPRSQLGFILAQKPPFVVDGAEFVEGLTDGSSGLFLLALDDLDDILLRKVEAGDVKDELRGTEVDEAAACAGLMVGG